jgi:uncharacterized membrane protein YjjP (DUF1212 family)
MTHDEIEQLDDVYTLIDKCAAVAKHLIQQGSTANDGGTLAKHNGRVYEVKLSITEHHDEEVAK